MLWIDRTEKAGRLVLWLALSSACVIAPISYIRAHTEEAARLEAARAAEHADMLAKEAAALAEKADLRVSIAGMGEYLTALDVSAASGSLWFTNATSRKGMLCVTGVAENQTAHTSSSSLVACKEVSAYTSAEHVVFMFAGGELKDVCPTQSVCRLKVKDAP